MCVFSVVIAAAIAKPTLLSSRGFPVSVHPDLAFRTVHELLQSVIQFSHIFPNETMDTFAKVWENEQS